MPTDPAPVESNPKMGKWMLFIFKFKPSLEVKQNKRPDLPGEYGLPESSAMLGALSK